MHKVLVRHAAAITEATAIRSTVVQSSLTSLRTRGHYDAWCALVDPKHRDMLVESIGPSWIPMEAAHAHYAACEALRLTQSEQLAIGEAVGDRIQGSFLATLMKSVRAAGFNPLSLFAHADRIHARLFQGSSVQVTQTGPKDIDLEIAGVPLCRYPYFRLGYTGAIHAGFMVVGAPKSHVKQQSYNATHNTFVIHAAWV
ncbi:MAG TPA: hypothetical protein VI299_01325 [Polyangiales bacterium]